MSRNIEKFTLTNGFIEISNNQINIKEKGNSFKTRVVTAILVIAFIYRLINKSNIFSKTDITKDYFYLVILVIVSLLFLALLTYFVFFHHWKNSMKITTITKIEIDKEDSLETEISIITNKSRQKHIEFRNLENQVEPFLEELKKRNSRIEIKHL